MMAPGETRQAVRSGSTISGLEKDRMTEGAMKRLNE